MLDEIYRQAGLTDDDINRMSSYAEGKDEFYGSEAYGKLFDYFEGSGEMPYGVAKCRDEAPDDWILEYLGLSL
jgi:hypothetical protein